jgi:UDP-N-acetylmuramate--alanine ligase
VLNLQKDHKEMNVVAEMFATFRAQTRETFVAGDDDNLCALVEGVAPQAPAVEGGRATAGARRAADDAPGPLQTSVFGLGDRAEVCARDVVLEPDVSRFACGGVTFTLPVPGRHNVENAVAAIAACRALDVPFAEMSGPLAQFQGVGRRFQTIGVARGVEVIDDFAHNPAKLAAALATAQRRALRVLAIYQPHGYGPTRFLRDDFVETFATALRPEDRLWMLEVYYAGGTAKRDFSAADIVAEIAARDVHAEFAASRAELVARVAAEARRHDLVLVMGARDPSLTALARDLLAAIGASAVAGERS